MNKKGIMGAIFIFILLLSVLVIASIFYLEFAAGKFGISGQVVVDKDMGKEILNENITENNNTR